MEGLNLLLLKIAALSTALGLIIPLRALADAPPQPPSISVTASGSIDFIPDIAKVTLGVRAQAPTAREATSIVNRRADGVIAAMRKLGIADRALKTTGYEI